MACISATDEVMPMMHVTLAGIGLPLLRLEKRMHCAAAGAGIRLELEVRKDYEMLGIATDDTPVVRYEGQVVFRGLPNTEAIEFWLKAR